MARQGQQGEVKVRSETADPDKDGRVIPWEFRPQHRKLL